MFDRRLLKSINSERCFALVGSGPSCEMGYPSWAKLAESTYRVVKASGVVKDDESYKKYLKTRDFPGLFRQAELDLGSRNRLVEIIRPLLVPEQKARGFIYDFLTRWPFACYLTTNYDDEIAAHLSRRGVHYQTVRNRIEDFYSLRDGASHLIVKLHSDLDHPEECILTSLDYKKLSTDDAEKYFRDKLRAIFEMFDVCIVGHSLSDFDLSIVLQTAKQTASPNHPIFCIVSDVTDAEKRDFLERYNIAVIPYDNFDGQHTRLRRILSLADKFIVPSEQRFGGKVPHPPSEDETEAAAALLIYRKLHGSGDKDVASPSEYIGPLILQALRSAAEGATSIDVILTLEPLKSTVRNESIREAVRQSIETLQRDKLVEFRGDSYVVSPKGVEQLTQTAYVREIEQKQAYGQFIATLKISYPQLSSADEAKATKILNDTIALIFKARGISIASAVFSGQSIRAEDLTDIFGVLSTMATTLPHGDLRASFVEAAHAFIVEPTPPQMQYLNSVSQGYFLYHLAGLDPLCTKIRRDLFQNTAWLFDSSVLLPLVAVGCHNHDYAVDLFSRLLSLNATSFTTRRLLDEAWDHLSWAIDFVRSNPFDSARFLAAAIVSGGFKQNLFIDGFVRLSAEGRVGTFADYLRLVCPTGVSQCGFDAQFSRYKISILDMESMVGFKEEDLSQVTDIVHSIKGERSDRGTYRNERQVKAEAEVLHLIRKIRDGGYGIPNHSVEIEKTYFVSQSRILDIVSPQDKLTTWTPEAFYRYLNSLPGEQTDPNLLQQCMLHEYYYAGVSFIDKPRYLKFFGPSINVSRISYNEEKTRYLELTEQTILTALDEAFDRTPDLEKPFFVSQMGWRAAEAAQNREAVAVRKASEAEARAKVLEAQLKKKAKVTEGHELARQRNLKDQKHQKKRLRQAKKRARRKSR